MWFNISNITFGWDQFVLLLRTILDIIIVWAIVYQLFKVVRRSVKTMQLFKGVLIILVIRVLSELMQLNTVAWLANQALTWGFLAIIIIFQPEIRGLLEKMGQAQIFTNFSAMTVSEKEMVVNEIFKTVDYLSSNRVGALISFERAQSMQDYVQTGVLINAIVKSELLISLFTPNMPLHDGAVIIQGSRITCASAYFPPTSKELSPRYGARHRAALGISEITDSVTIIVSEETGNVSFAIRGELTRVSVDEFKQRLMDEIGLFVGGEIYEVTE